ncbi:MAG: c-type cytochrome [Rhizobiaceae bacterium]
MDSFELNKIVGALLGTIFVVMSVSLARDGLFDNPAPAKPGFEIVAAEAGAGGGEAAAPAAVEPVGPLLASADAAAGEVVFKKCASCHTVDNGGANKVGPNLWGIVGRGMGTHAGFNYSAGMKEFSAGKSWDYEALASFVTKPKAYIKGTTMGFVGVAKPEERANLIAYLRSLSDSPVPLP